MRPESIMPETNLLSRGQMRNRTRLGGFLGGALAIFFLAGTSGCEVTNPGPVQDEFLADQASHAPLVNGSARRLAQSIKNLAYDGALISREIFPSGQIGAHGHNVVTQGGFVEDDSNEFNGRWNFTQQARFIAEDALRRFIDDGVLPASEHNSSPLIARANVLAGYASRVLGEHWCHAVLDGGPVEPGSAFFERAEARFTTGMEVAQNAGNNNLRLAAVAGRAQVRMWLGNWSGAASDAAQIPNDFVFVAEMDGDPAGARNRIWFATADLPYRTFSLYRTWHREYYLETGDPRVPSTVDPTKEFSTGSLSGFGQVPFVIQQKYPAGDTDIRLASGWEMRLVEAEALLNQGQWQQAMDLINEVRTRNVSDSSGEALQPWTAGSLEEAWRYLKRERRIELWMEGRSWGDMRRWEDTGTPGAIDWPDYESVSPLFSSNPRSRCLSIPTAERNSNPNVPSDIDTSPLWASPGSPPGQG
jgi:starch-binding outer membrane protein, SusD/RagB family